MKTNGKGIGLPERPAELIYALDEIPPWPQLLALGFQHVAVICPYLVMVALVAEAAKLPHHCGAERHRPRHDRGCVHDSTAEFAARTRGFGLSLSSGRLGHLSALLPAVAASFGISAVCGMVIFAGACEIAVASLVNRTRKLFPAVVSGVVIIAVGLELGKIGASVLFEHTAAHSDQTIASFATAVCTLAAMTGLAVWATGLPKLFCSLIGILVGYAVGRGLPRFSVKLFRQTTAAASAFRRSRPQLSILYVRSLFRRAFRDRGTCLGSAGDRRADDVSADERRRVATPRYAQHRAGVRADGLGCLVGGLLGVPGMSAAPTLVSVEKTTGATSRVIAWSIALWFILLSCLPKFAGLIVNMPRPVMAAALVLQRRPHAGCGHPDHRQPSYHSACLDHHRIFALGGADSADFSRVLSVVARLDPSVHWFDYFHGGGRRCAPQRCTSARDVALQSFASRYEFRACHGGVVRCFL